MGSPVNNSRTVMVGDNLNSALASTAIEELIQDTSPQLGADLDCNGYDIQFDDGTGIEDDSGNKTLIFGKTTSATTYAKITNNSTGTTGPLLASAGETNVDLRLAAAGTGDIKVTTGGLRVTSDNESISVGAGNDLALTHDGSNSTITGGVGKITVTPAAGSVLELDNSNATVDNGSVQVTGDLDVDNISIDGNTVSSTSGDLQLKAVSGASITFQDDADATKQLTLNFATIGSGVERTWTFPNSDGTFGAGMSDLSDDSSPQLGADLDCNGSQIQWSQGADVASGTALAVLTDGNYFEVTGTTTITSINTTGGIGTQIKLHFNGALTLTHDSTDLVLPGGANITTAAGDEAEFIEYGSGDYRCTYYTKATGGPVLIPANSVDSDAYVDGSIDGVHLAVGKDGALSLNGAPADHTANGPQTNTFAAGYTTTQSDLVYLSSAGRWEEADADAAGAAAINLLGIAMEVKDDGEAMNVALPGSFIQDESVFDFGSDIGKPLYMHTTDGAITATKPTGSGDAVRTVGYAVHADMIFFNPSSDYVTLA